MSLPLGQTAAVFLDHAATTRTTTYKRRNICVDSCRASSLSSSCQTQQAQRLRWGISTLYRCPDPSLFCSAWHGVESAGSSTIWTRHPGQKLLWIIWRISHLCRRNWLFNKSWPVTWSDLLWAHIVPSPNVERFLNTNKEARYLSPFSDGSSIDHNAHQIWCLGTIFLKLGTRAECSVVRAYVKSMHRS